MPRLPAIAAPTPRYISCLAPHGDLPFSSLWYSHVENFPILYMAPPIHHSDDSIYGPIQDEVLISLEYGIFSLVLLPLRGEDRTHALRTDGHLFVWFLFRYRPRSSYSDRSSNLLYFGKPVEYVSLSSLTKKTLSDNFEPQTLLEPVRPIRSWLRTINKATNMSTVFGSAHNRHGLPGILSKDVIRSLIISFATLLTDHCWHCHSRYRHHRWLLRFWGQTFVLCADCHQVLFSPTINSSDVSLLQVGQRELSDRQILDFIDKQCRNHAFGIQCACGLCALLATAKFWTSLVSNDAPPLQIRAIIEPDNSFWMWFLQQQMNGKLHFIFDTYEAETFRIGSFYEPAHHLPVLHCWACNAYKPTDIIAPWHVAGLCIDCSHWLRQELANRPKIINANQLLIPFKIAGHPIVEHIGQELCDSCLQKAASLRGDHLTVSFCNTCEYVTVRRKVRQLDSVLGTLVFVLHARLCL